MPTKDRLDQNRQRMMDQAFIELSYMKKGQTFPVFGQNLHILGQLQNSPKIRTVEVERKTLPYILVNRFKIKRKYVYAFLAKLACDMVTSASVPSYMRKCPDRGIYVTTPDDVFRIVHQLNEFIKEYKEAIKERRK